MALSPPVTPGWVETFARAVHGSLTETDRLQRGAELAVELLPACDHAGVAVTTASSVETAAATDDVARQGDAWQYELGEGPCLDAAREERTTLCHDLVGDATWPSWGARVARELGVRSMLSVVLETGRRHVGALNLYADRPGSFDDDQVEDARLLAALLAVAAADAREIGHRIRGMSSRTTIGQAQGLLMERFGLDADGAFGVLRRISQHDHRPVVQVAEDLVRTRRVPSHRSAGDR